MYIEVISYLYEQATEKYKNDAYAAELYASADAMASP
jgi:hypothetical protein